MNRSSLRAAFAAVCVVVSSFASAQSSVPSTESPTDPSEPTSIEESAPVLETVVHEQSPFTAASSRTVRDRDFLLRPRPRPADLLQVVPGLYLNQHAGGGKANQYFLRGFDADHGTDVALFVDGVPVNLVSHGHGQGYADLNWLIPEVVKRVEVHKGPYSAEYGDFATAGAINLVTHDALPDHQLTVSGGSFGTYRAVGLLSPELAGVRTFLAGQVYGTDGPFERPEDLERYSLFAKVSRPLGERGQVFATLNAYGSGWNASGQIPLRAVRAGELARFGSIDPDEGGQSQRNLVQVGARGANARGDELAVMGYLGSYRLNLFSNFTFFSRDPVNGDMIEQRDERTLMGATASYRFTREWAGIGFQTTFGGQLRSDLIANALYYDRGRERLESVVEADVRESSVGIYAEEQLVFTRWLRAVLGLRADYFGFHADDRLGDGSGVRDASLLSPKASLVFAAGADTELYANFGSGFHSNDARGVVLRTDPVTPLTRAVGGELGARTRLFDRLDLAASAFLLDLDSELVWVGDEGVTEARGPTRRLGVEAELRWRLLSWLWADLDVSVTNGRFVDAPSEANAIPLAPTLVVSGGVSMRHPTGWFGRLGAFHLGDRPATEDRFLAAEGFTRVDATVGYRHRHFELGVAVQNALNAEWREAQFGNVSRLADETGPASCGEGARPASDASGFLGCEDLHFTPGAPFNVQATASVYF